MKNSTLDAANFIANLRFSLEQESGIPDDWQPQDTDVAYRIQTTLVEKLIEKDKGRPVGYKIGCTNKIAQDLLGTDGPFYGVLLSSYVYSSPANLNHSDFSIRCIEAEFAFEMGKDLPARGSTYEREEVASAVKNLLPAIEIVDTRTRIGLR